jgi:hypothetical protein
MGAESGKTRRDLMQPLNVWPGDAAYRASLDYPGFRDGISFAVDDSKSWDADERVWSAATIKRRAVPRDPGLYTA